MEDGGWRFSILDSRSSILDLKSSILDSLSSTRLPNQKWFLTRFFWARGFSNPPERESGQECPRSFPGLR